jgi:hypothetical protein
MTAKSKFVIDKKTPTPVEWNVGGVVRNRYEKTFSGDNHRHQPG